MSSGDFQFMDLVRGFRAAAFATGQMKGIAARADSEGEVLERRALHVL